MTDNGKVPLNWPIVRVRPTAKLPVKANSDDAAFDFFVDLHAIGEKVTLYPGRRIALDLGIASAIPQGWFLRLAPRSGLARDRGIMIMGGVIDAGYRGEINVLLYNSSTEYFVIDHGAKIVQGYFVEVPMIEPREVTILPSSERGTGGFGSTGV